MKSARSKKAFTLIEVIFSIVILSISLTSLCLLIMNVVRQNVLSQAQATAVALGEGEMERVTSMRFSAIDNVAQTNFNAPFTAYSYTINVDYVNSGALETPVAGPTDYRRVRIVISNAVSGDITLTALATNH